METIINSSPYIVIMCNNPRFSSLCKVRMGQRDSLDEDMRKTVESLRSHSQSLDGGGATASAFSRGPSIVSRGPYSVGSPRIAERLAERRQESSGVGEGGLPLGLSNSIILSQERENPISDYYHIWTYVL